MSYQLFGVLYLTIVMSHDFFGVFKLEINEIVDSNLTFLEFLDVFVCVNKS